MVFRKTAPQKCGAVLVLCAVALAKEGFTRCSF